MSTYSEPYDFDEIPIRNADNIVVGYAHYEGRADLIVACENGTPELDYIDAIYVEASGEGREGELIKLKESDPVFITIEFEIKRRAAEGKIEFECPADFETDHDFQRREYRAAVGY